MFGIPTQITDEEEARFNANKARHIDDLAWHTDRFIRHLYEFKKTWKPADVRSQTEKFLKLEMRAVLVSITVICKLYGFPLR